MTVDPIDWLFGLAQFGIKFGLHNMQAIVAELGHPERSYRTVHVAGTNGKGSVTAMVDGALSRAGLRTGRYTSPHLLDLTERFAVNGTPVAHADLRDAVNTVRDTVEHLRAHGTLDVHPTFFEVTTAVGFLLFQRHAVDVAVCEVGLGGRLDATNVITPMACAITSIAFDHEQYLGGSLREIALEKAGIIKPTVPVVVGPLGSDAAQAIAAVAAERGAPLIRAMDDVTLGAVEQTRHGQHVTLRTPVRDYGDLQLGLDGRHQVDNAVVAVRLLETLESRGVPVGADAVAHALASVRWPGRLQHVQLPEGREMLLDAAHNPAGAEALANYLGQQGEARPIVFGAMRDKNIAAMLRALAPAASHLVLTRPSNPRAADPAELQTLARSLAPGVAIEVVADPNRAVERAFSHRRHIVVAGSIFLLADVMKGLGR